MRSITVHAGAGAVLILAMATGLLGAVRGDGSKEAWKQGSVACSRGEFGLAIRWFTEAIRLNPGDAAEYNNRGYAYLRNGEFDHAIADYDEALRLKPKFARAHFFRGSAFEKRGDLDKAVADFARAIRLDATYAREYCDLNQPASSPPRKAGAPATTPRRRTYFIAPEGNDHGPGTIERPFATLYKAHQVAEPGDTINFRRGTYQVMMNWGKSGAPNAPITIQAYNGEEVRVQCSEQYAWARVDDPTFGLCWKASIPNRPIRYPGFEGSVWQDAERSPANVHVSAIVKNGYLCADMNASSDFANPRSAVGIPLTDRDGRLLFDITWFDRSSKTLWFKPKAARPINPNGQLYVISQNCGQFSASASYLKIIGVKFEYLFDFHQQDHPTGCDISNCEIKHAAQGLVGGGIRCTYTSLFVDKVGDWLTWRYGRYDRGYLAHCFYFNGSRCVVANCFFGRSNKGGAIQNYPDGELENLFDGNVLYNCDGGSIFMGSEKNYIMNNICLQKTTNGINPYISMQGFTFAHNYSEAANPFGFTVNESDGEYKGTFERFAITANVWRNMGGSIDYCGNVVDARKCKIDGNVYLGDQHWRVGLTENVPPLKKERVCTNYADYLTALRALHDCATWERTSRAGSTAARFDYAAFDTLLDMNPPLDEALTKARRYVAEIIVPLGGAGPDLDGLPEGRAAVTREAHDADEHRPAEIQQKGMPSAAR